MHCTKVLLDGEPMTAGRSFSCTTQRNRHQRLRACLIVMGAHPSDTGTRRLRTKPCDFMTKVVTIGAWVAAQSNLATPTQCLKYSADESLDRQGSRWAEQLQAPFGSASAVGPTSPGGERFTPTNCRRNVNSNMPAASSHRSRSTALFTARRSPRPSPNGATKRRMV